MGGTTEGASIAITVIAEPKAKLMGTHFGSIMSGYDDADA
jgi:hypothetical protein